MTATTEAQGLIAKDAFLEVSQIVSGSFSFTTSTNVIARTAGSFVTDGINIGDTLYSDAADVPNQGPLTVTAVTTLSVTVAETLTTHAAAAINLTDYVKVSEVISMNTPSGEPAEIDMTHLRSPVKQFRNGLRDEGSITGQMNFIGADPGQLILRAMAKESAPRTVRITLPAQDGFDGYRWTFDALGRGGQASVATDQRVTQDFTLRVTSEPVEEVVEAA